MNDAVREADKIVGEYLERLGYVTCKRSTASKKGRRIVLCAALSLALCVFLSYIVINFMI